jgi:hypothetical protein
MPPGESKEHNPFAAPKSAVKDVAQESITSRERAARIVQGIAWVGVAATVLLSIYFFGLLLLAAASGTGVGRSLQVLLLVLLAVTTGLFIAAAKLRPKN